MNEQEKKILDFVKRKGPVLPVEVKKEFGGDTMLMGALLSGLIDNKHIKFTIAKVGGSPLYYVDGQEHKLSRLRDHLSEKPGKAYDILKDKKVMRDKECEPWQRVALREIKDFAKPISIDVKGNSEVFWRWHLLPNENASKRIMEMIKDESPGEEPKVEAEEENPAAEINKEVELEPPKEEPKNPEPPKEEKPKEEPKNPEPPKPKEEQKVLKPKRKKETYRADDDEDMAAELGKFHARLVEFFRDKDIVVIEQKVIKKGKEFSFVLKVPSTVGRLCYYAVAKDKKKASEKELGDVFSKAEELKMPAMYICSGSLSKKARKFLDEKLPGLMFKGI